MTFGRLATTSGSEMAHYLDTSALVKLIVSERESAALRSWLTQDEREPVTSDLARTELMRAVRRIAPDLAVRARQVIDAMHVLSLTTETYDSAARLDPPILRTLDALHLASALEIGSDLDAMIVYDERLSQAAHGYGIPTLAPS
ncbi:Predicted nucleic acid-binding protein, contains PIN domain [Paramicrobacterium humi]|uniref:Ribonuclease VapC n=1 Tax=Paramicrobacterium humi TaxID=640635 RepID=A0A1H4IR97_9MICO|nr:type II toxin-antitoxin system VapC family toxin [Microbacterium humi]SEB36365.1 Predicted nucleic acid-binding protein, contains PIN domain [Microbacterium humi]